MTTHSLPDQAWLEPAAEDALHRPTSLMDWLGHLLGAAVFALLGTAGLALLRSSFTGGWNVIWLIPALLLLGIGVYGMVRMVTALFGSPNMPRPFHLTNLELSHEQTLGSLGEVLIRGRLHCKVIGKNVIGKNVIGKNVIGKNVIGKNVPKSLRVTLNLQPEHHPNKQTYLNHSETRFDASGCEFVIEVPRHQTVFEPTHCALEINFADQAVFYRLNLEPITQTPPIQIVYQPSKREQLEAFKNGDANELISRAYNGQHASAGWLRHHGGSCFSGFSLAEQAAVFSIRFSELIDHLEREDWFAPFMVDQLHAPFEGHRILRTADAFQVMYDQSDESLTWLTRSHQATVLREALEAFVLHSDKYALALKGAEELLELRSDGSNSRPAQSY
jgi:hypothetical protein